MKLILAPNKNETPPPQTFDLIEEDGKGRRTVYASIMFDFFYDTHREIYNKLKADKEVEIEIKEVE
jgi:hypothetical protein